MPGSRIYRVVLQVPTHRDQLDSQNPSSSDQGRSSACLWHPRPERSLGNKQDDRRVFRGQVCSGLGLRRCKSKFSPGCLWSGWDGAVLPHHQENNKNKQTDSNADMHRRSLWYQAQFSTSHILTHLIFTVNAVITSILQVREVRYRQNKTNKQTKPGPSEVGSAPFICSFQTEHTDWPPWQSYFSFSFFRESGFLVLF